MENDNKFKNFQKIKKVIINPKPFNSYDEFLNNLQSLKNELFFYSGCLERKKQNFKKNIKYVNEVSGESYDLDYSLKSETERNIREKQQLIYHLIAKAKKQNYQPIFMTVTAPSEYHPAKTKNQKINKNFKFKALENAITPAYQFLQDFWRKFYMNAKTVTKKELIYIKMYEMHNSLIPHLHILFLTKEEYIEKMVKLFKNYKKKYKLSQTDIQLPEKIDNTTAYITKYLFKSFDKNSNYKMRVLDGWKKYFKIRAFAFSQTKLNLEYYQDIYYNMTQEAKKIIDEIIDDPNSEYDNYFSYIEDHFEIVKEEKIELNLINDNELDI